MKSEAAFEQTDSTEVAERPSDSTGQELCAQAQAQFVAGLRACHSEAEARDELKLLLVDAMTVVHRTPLEDVLSRAYREVTDATDSGHPLRIHK